VYTFGHGASGANGPKWIDIQGDNQGFGNLLRCRLAGSGNEGGLVYVGTNGRGVFYDKGGWPPESPDGHRKGHDSEKTLISSATTLVKTAEVSTNAITSASPTSPTGLSNS